MTEKMNAARFVFSWIHLFNYQNLHKFMIDNYLLENGTWKQFSALNILTPSTITVYLKGSGVGFKCQVLRVKQLSQFFGNFQGHHYIWSFQGGDFLIF